MSLLLPRQSCHGYGCGVGLNYYTIKVEEFTDVLFDYEH